jgi:hypothetical protein
MVFLVGFVNAGLLEGYCPMVAAFRQGLQESRYAEGRDVAIEYHWADGKNDRLPAIVADLVRRIVERCDWVAPGWRGCETPTGWFWNSAQGRSASRLRST